MNLLTFDIEEWYIEAAYNGDRQDRYIKFNTILGQILDVLDECGLKATFFCLGKMVSDFPQVIKRIDERGHEIGCHSDKHMWLTKLSQIELRKDTVRAIDALENCVGKKVVSYRAPAFSIGEGNKWALEILAESGIERDASIFPASRDFGGFASFTENGPSIIAYNGIMLKEFPVSTISLLGKKTAYAGGGYFRLFPYYFVHKIMNANNYSMTYFHIGDLLPEKKKFMSRQEYETYFKEPGLLVSRCKRYVKSNLGSTGARRKLMKLLRNAQFLNLAQADTIIDWNTVPRINL